MTKHIFVTPQDHIDKDCYPGMICDGGLALCSVCGGLEGGLTSDCPEEQMTEEEVEKVYKGEIDFIDGQWVNKVSPHSPACYRERFS